jgi:hypothetical protein
MMAIEPIAMSLGALEAYHPSIHDWPALTFSVVDRWSVLYCLLQVLEKGLTSQVIGKTSRICHLTYMSRLVEHTCDMCKRAIIHRISII